MKRTVLALAALFLLPPVESFSQKPDMENYFAWCIVPFDNQDRSPEQRIAMLKDLGFTSYAYDWRAEHLPEMPREIELARRKGIEINAVWMWLDHNDSVGNLSANNRKLLQILEDANLKTQIWVSFPGSYFAGSNDRRLKKAVNMIGYVSDAAEKIGCTVGLYNHGGWFGRPENLVKIAEALAGRQVGIVFNFHHAHDMIDEFPELLKLMQSYLWAVNLNGMNPAGPKILPIGAGEKEAEMLTALKASGFNGPFGILGHVEDEDVKIVLKRNLDGLKHVLKAIEE